MSAEDRAAQLEFLLDHYDNPRNRGEMPDADVHLQGGHEGCADIVTMYLKLEDGRIRAVSFTGKGCTISQAAASMVTEMVAGMTPAEVQAVDYHALVDLLGEEVVKTRPRCATLALDTVKAALQEYRAQKIRAGEL